MDSLIQEYHILTIDMKVKYPKSVA